MKVGVLTNLNARKNRSRGPTSFSSTLGPDGIVRHTRDVAEIPPVIEEFIESGCEYWVSDGGDGTLHWLMNEGRKVLRARGLWRTERPYPYLVPSNGGAFDFVARTAGIKGRAEQVVSTLVNGLRAGQTFPTVELDTIEVRGHRPGDPAGTWPFERIGFAVALGGIGQKFFSEFYKREDRNPLGIIDVSARTAVGHIATLPPFKWMPFISEDLRALGRRMFSGTRAEVVADGRRFDYGVFQGLHASSVEIDFGTMRLFGHAREPGQMHIVVGALPLRECAYKWMWYVVGKPLPGKRWHEFPGQALDVRAVGAELIDPVIDGEMYHGLDQVSVRLGPRVAFPVIRAGAD
jgi:hypothetical protein